MIQDRKRRMKGDEAEKWKRFVELRRPEQMQKWPRMLVFLSSRSWVKGPYQPMTRGSVRVFG